MSRTRPRPRRQTSRFLHRLGARGDITEKAEESDRTQKPLNPSINSDFTPFHEPKNRSPNISLTEIIENQQKRAQKVVLY